MKNDVNKTDRRVLHTKMFIRNALFELIEEKPVDKISITELCERADINRNTFYKYYFSPRDVLESIENEFLDRVSELELRNQNPSILLKEVCNAMYEKKQFSKIIFSDNADRGFVEKIKNICKKLVLTEAKPFNLGIPDETTEIIYNYVTEGCLSVIRVWIVNDIKKTPEEIADIIRRLSNRGLISFCEEEIRK